MWRQYLSKDEGAWNSYFQYLYGRREEIAGRLGNTSIEDLPVLKGQAKEVAEALSYATLLMREEQENAVRRTGA